MDTIAVCKILEAHEGLVPHLYLDTQGLPTVGVGCRVFSAQASLALPWRRPDGSAPLAHEITEDFARVVALPKGQRADIYGGPLALLLALPDIDGLLQDRLNQEFLPGLRSALQGFDAMPAPAQLALIDMAFNLGVRGLVGGFPHLVAAANGADWSAAAWNCHRKTCRDDRNAWTRSQFLAARMAT